MRHLKRALGAAALTLALSGALAGEGLPQLATVKVGPYEVGLHNDSPTAVTGANTFYLEVHGVRSDAWLELELRGPAGQHLKVPLTRLESLTGHGHGGDSHGAGDDHGASDSHGGTDDHSEASDDHATAATDDHAEANGDDHDAGTADKHGAAPADDHATAGADEHAAGADDHPEGDAHADGDDHAATDAHTTADAHDEGADDRAAPSKAAPAAPAAVPAEGKWTAVVTVREPGGYRAVGSASLTASYGGPSRAYVGLSGLIVFSSLAAGIVGRRRRTAKGVSARVAR